jgi:hypothetical protein
LRERWVELGEHFGEPLGKFFFHSS